MRPRLLLFSGPAAAEGLKRVPRGARALMSSAVEVGVRTTTECARRSTASGLEKRSANRSFAISCAPAAARVRSWDQRLVVRRTLEREAQDDRGQVEEMGLKGTPRGGLR